MKPVTVTGFMVLNTVPPQKTSSVTIRDVARRAGVSVATVSRVLNNKALIAPATNQRVEDAIAELNYFPRAAARSLSGNKTNTIGLLLPEIGWDNFFPPMLQGIEAGCYETSFNLLIHSTSHIQPDSHGHRPIGEHNTDGLIIFTDALRDEEIVRLHQDGFPLVLLHRSPPKSLSIPHVVFENKSGARKMTDHMIEVHGCRKIAFLSGPQHNEDARWRELGYRESLAAHDIVFDPGLVRPGYFDESLAHQAMETWLMQGFLADVIFAADDDSAYGAVRAVLDSGRHIPDEIPIVGFDDSPTSRLLLPPLTTVRAPIQQAGYKAAQLLGQLIHTGQAEQEVLLPTELVVRRSCGCNSIPT